MLNMDPGLKLFKVHSLIHNSLSCHKFLFRKLSAFLHFIFISADMAAFGCCLKQAVVFQNHFQNWITFFAHFRPLKNFNKMCRIISLLKFLWKTLASSRFTKTIILLVRNLADGKWTQSSSNSWYFFWTSVQSSGRGEGGLVFVLSVPASSRAASSRLLALFASK